MHDQHYTPLETPDRITYVSGPDGYEQGKGASLTIKRGGANYIVHLTDWDVLRIMQDLSNGMIADHVARTMEDDDE